jgi:hypothetical protein
MLSIKGARRLSGHLVISALAVVAFGSVAAPPSGEAKPTATASQADAARVAPESRAKRLRERARATCARAGRLSRRARAARRSGGRPAKARPVCRSRRARARRAAAATSGSRLAAPVLRVSGNTISWARVADVNRYVLATKVPNRATAYRLVTGTSVTPPPVPGVRVTYGLRTDVPGSAWAREVSIAYPATTTVPAPSPAPAPALGGFEAGAVSGADVLTDAKVTGRLGARVVRVEFAIGKPAAELRAAIDAHARNGTRVVPLAGFHARMPTVAEARNLGAWAREFGPGGTFWSGRSDGHLAVRQIEFGNETSYGYQYGDNWDKPSYSERAREYALRFRDAHEAIRAANPGVGLLAQGEDANTGSMNWVNGMFNAVPDLASRVAGWTIHPYGPRTRWEPRIDRMIEQLGSRGVDRTSLPIWITEWGLSSDDGRCLSDNYYWNRCMTFAQAASALTTSVADMRARYGSRLRAFFVYQARDQYRPGYSTNREHYFGALRNDLSEKGPYSAAVRALMAAS